MIRKAKATQPRDVQEVNVAFPALVRRRRERKVASNVVQKGKDEELFVVDNDDDEACVHTEDHRWSDGDNMAVEGVEMIAEDTDTAMESPLDTAVENA